MKILKLFLSFALCLGMAMVSVSALATPGTMGASGVCPQTTGHAAFGGGGVGNATDCNLFITFNADGSITTTAGPQTTYDSIEDALIGVINNTNHAITSFAISGSNILAFDNDGICGYINPGIVCSTTAQHGYGGQHASFIITNVNSGTVNFSGGGIAAGGHDFFSLEEAININAPPVITLIPEPETYALMLAGIGLMGFVSRGRRQRAA
jgi:hypothetical protein